MKTQEKALTPDLYENAFEVGLGGEKPDEYTPDPLKEKLNKLPSHLKAAADGVVSHAMLQGRNERMRLSKDVDLLWKGMQFFLAGETPPEQYKLGTDTKAIECREGYMTRLRLYAPYMDKAVARLGQMGEEDKAKVYFMLKEKKRKKDTTAWAATRAMGRGINNLWMNAAQLGGNMTAYMMDELAGAADNVLGAHDTAQGMKHSSKQLDGYLKGVEELRRMAQEELASLELKPDSTWVD